ncbi:MULTISPECIES: hypothetical protein [Sphingobium]|uniref:hypothetical protein n=1 Tax=Sphingobium sp. MI1205 TaxID=407020 RepID=UPI0007701A33|nr:hypothetical protein [Sphingobium sp. MI1205]AMK17113.1 hypothetical protein K663_03630 [Sphingobium sp. MI1205]
MIVAILGGLLVGLAAMLLYLAAPHQQMGRLPCPPRLAGWGGVALLILGTGLLLGWAGVATGIFIVLTLVMTVWSVVPVIIAWQGGAAEDKR